jgi:hypothetical protein
MMAGSDDLPVMPLSDLALQYVAERRASRDLEPSTAVCVRSTLLQFCRFVGDDVAPDALSTSKRGWRRCRGRGARPETGSPG